MALLFEKLLTRLSVQVASSLGVRVADQRTVDLDEQGGFVIKPDLIVLREWSVVAVADVKYKLLDDHGRFPNANTY